jgi:hypothetical protein
MRILHAQTGANPKNVFDHTVLRPAAVIRWSARPNDWGKLCVPRTLHQEQLVGKTDEPDQRDPATQLARHRLLARPDLCGEADQARAGPIGAIGLSDAVPPRDEQRGGVAVGEHPGKVDQGLADRGPGRRALDFSTTTGRIRPSTASASMRPAAQPSTGTSQATSRSPTTASRRRSANRRRSASLANGRGLSGCAPAASAKSATRSKGGGPFGREVACFLASSPRTSGC